MHPSKSVQQNMLKAWNFTKNKRRCRCFDNNLPKNFSINILENGNCFNPLSANPTKWSNTLKQFAGNLPTNCLSVFDHFVKLALTGLIAKLPFICLCFLPE